MLPPCTPHALSNFLLPSIGHKIPAVEELRLEHLIVGAINSQTDTIRGNVRAIGSWNIADSQFEVFFFAFLYIYIGYFRES